MMTPLMKSLVEVDKRLYFLFLCLLTFLVLWLKKNFLEFEIPAFQVLEYEGKLGWFKLITGLQYLSIPLVYLYKFTVTAFIIWVGCFMFGYRITYLQLWGLALVAEVIFVVPELIKVFWFMNSAKELSLFEIRAFYPFSLMQFFNYQEIDVRWHYPLKALNIFELFYWVMLIYGIHAIAGKKIRIAALIILTSYIPLFLMWLLFFATVYK